MTVGVLLVAHADVAEVMWRTACQIVGRPAAGNDVRLLPVPFDADIEPLFRRLCDLAQAVDQGDGVLVLSDLYGATPANLASRLCQAGGHSLTHIAGLNLPMLLRLINYADLPGDELCRFVIDGGRDGIVVDASCQRRAGGG